MSATAAADPVREQVEAALRRLCGDVAALPCETARRARRAASRSLDGVTERVAAPLGMVRSMVELSLSGLLGRLQPVDVADRTSAPNPPADPVVGTTSSSVEIDETTLEKGGDATVDDVVFELPLEGYESLAASHVVARLDRLDADELEQIRTFELAHRGRRTILGKIDQLLAAR